jgi:hypothetical protein
MLYFHLSLEDINLDYGYGYDYEQVIKERLIKANQELNSEKNKESKRKSVKVVFDNDVTEVQVPADTETESTRKFIF